MTDTAEQGTPTIGEAVESPAIKEASEKVLEAAKSAFTPKGVARFLVGSSVKFVVTSSIASLVPAETRIEKAKVYVGAYVISGMLVEKAKAYISDDLDDKIAFAREVIEKVREMESGVVEAREGDESPEHSPTAVYNITNLPPR